MHSSLNKSRKLPQKIKNILARHSCSTQIKFNSMYQHPEANYIMKYAPKYYHSLTLEMNRQPPLFSKVKKIKKLKKCTGLFKDSLPQKMWFNLLANTRKEIEELPEIICTKKQQKLSESFWRRLNLQKIKFFSGVKRVFLQKESEWKANSNNDFLSIKEHFIKYLGNMRNLKSLESMDKNDGGQVQWFLRKLNGMSKLLGRLEVLALHLSNFDRLMQEFFFQNKKVLFHLTGLRISEWFDQNFVDILQMCNNLKSLSLDIENDNLQNADILSLLTFIQHLEKLVSLQLGWPSQVKDFWSHFKPPSTLCSLKLKFFASNLVNDEFFEGGMENTMLKDKDLVKHWEDIKDLDLIEFEVKCQKFLLVRPFITQVLKKVRKLRAFKCSIDTDLSHDGNLTHEPFVIEEVAHLYESLEKFEYTLTNSIDVGYTKYDLGKMKPFRNLKEVKLGGNRIIYENIEKIVDLLQENKSSVLEVEVEVLHQPDGLKKILKRIAKEKRMDRDLKVRIDLKFKTKDFAGLLDELYEKIEPIKTRKGLEICLSLVNLKSSSQILTKSLIGTLEKYLKVRNSIVRIWNRVQHLELIRVDGEKEQFYIDDIV